MTFSFLFLLALRAGPSAAETAFYHPEDIRQLSQVFMAAQDRAARGADQTQAQLEAAGPVLVELDRDGTLVGGRAQPEFIQYAQDVRKQATGSFLRIQAFVDVFTDDFQATFEAAVERALPEVGAGLQVEQCKATGIHALLGHSQCEGQDLNAALAARLDEDPVLRAQVEEILAIPWPEFKLGGSPQQAIPLTGDGPWVHLDALVVGLLDDEVQDIVARNELGMERVEASMEEGSEAERQGALAEGQRLRGVYEAEMAALGDDLFTSLAGAWPRLVKKGAPEIVSVCANPRALGGCAGEDVSDTVVPLILADRKLLRTWGP